MNLIIFFIIVWVILLLYWFTKERPKQVHKSGASKTPLHILIGLVIMAGGGSIFYGSDILMVLLFAVVCTGGLGLIPIVLVAKLLGFLVYTAFAATETERPSLSVASSKNQQVMDFIVSAKRSGLSPGEIDLMLNNKGWQQEEIDRVLKEYF